MISGGDGQKWRFIGRLQIKWDWLPLKNRRTQLLADQADYQSD